MRTDEMGGHSRPAKVGASYKRVELSPAPGQRAASVWATVSQDEPGQITVRLIHRYPDLKPAAGWLVRVDGAAFEVDEVLADGAMECSSAG